MKHSTIVVKNTIFLFTALFTLFSISACATKTPFMSSSVVPAARGTVKIKKDNNENHVISIEITNLAEPGRLTPARNSYVVWMESGNRMVKNIGQIVSDSGFMSQTLKASFEAVSSTKPTKIFITAEDDPGASYPNSVVVFTTRTL